MDLKRPQAATLLTTLATAALALAACGTAADAPDVDAGQVAAGDGLAVVDEDPVDYEACARISEDVQSLLESTMTCEKDGACEAMYAEDILSDACLPSISCYVAVADPVELAPIREELRDLDREYRNECGLCPVANCVDEEAIYAQCEGGSCDVEARARVENTMALAPAVN